MPLRLDDAIDIEDVTATSLEEDLRVFLETLTPEQFTHLSQIFNVSQLQLLAKVLSHVPFADAN